MAEAVRKSILLVDDDADVLVSLRRLVERTMPDARFFSAESPKDALLILEREKIDVVVSDFRMPGMDGIEFLEQAKRRSPDLLTIMLTAYPTPNIAKEAVRRGGVILLVTKPFDPEAFVDVIKAIAFGR